VGTAVVYHRNMAVFLAVAGSTGVAIILLLRWRRRHAVPQAPVVCEVASAAAAALMYEAADSFLSTLGGLGGGLLVLAELYPFAEYVRFRAQSYEEILDRTDAERQAAADFDRINERWSDAQRAAINRFEDEWPRLESLLRRRGLEADLNEFADVVLVTKLTGLLGDPIAKNHALIADGFIKQPADRDRSDKQLVKDFLRYMGDVDLLPHEREIAARLCVLRATEALRRGQGSLRDLCTQWGEEWRDRFPRGFIPDPTAYTYGLYIWILRDIFTLLGRRVPPMDVEQGLFFEAIEDYRVDRYQETLESGSADTITEMARVAPR